MGNSGNAPLWLRPDQPIPPGFRTAHKQVGVWCVVRESDLAVRFVEEHPDEPQLDARTFAHEFEIAGLGYVPCHGRV